MPSGHKNYFRLIFFFPWECVHICVHAQFRGGGAEVEREPPPSSTLRAWSSTRSLIPPALDYDRKIMTWVKAQSEPLSRLSHAGTLGLILRNSKQLWKLSTSLPLCKRRLCLQGKASLARVSSSAPEKGGFLALGLWKLPVEKVRTKSA